MSTACESSNAGEGGMRETLQIGDCVRLNERGRRGARRPDRVGVVAAISRSGTQYSILWDGVRATQVFSVGFIERAPDPVEPRTVNQSA